jgi:type I restriction enzyme, S subunit
MDDLLRMTFGDLGSLFDGPHATPTRRAEGPFFLNISSLKAGRLDLAESDHVSEEDFVRWTKRVTPQPNDLLFSYETRIGEAALMPEGVRACLGRRMALLRPNPNIIDARFLLYFYLSPEFQQTIAQNTIHGATVPRIGLATMPSWPVAIPQLSQQRAIAEVLGALDDKIAANQRVIELCDQFATTLWSRDCADGQLTPLSSLARFVNGRAYTKNATGTGRVVIRIAELNSGIGGSTVFNDIEVPDENIARPGDLLFAWSGSLTVARWFRPEAIINQHIFKVIPRESNPVWLVDQALRALLDRFKSIAADKATTMGHIQRKHLDELVYVPTDERLAEISDLMSSLWQRALSAEQESLALARTRDELLPLLMSGKLRVKDAEKKVEAIV